MMHGNTTIPIPGELRSVLGKKIVTSADGVYDYNKNKYQEEINSFFSEYTAGLTNLTENALFIDNDQSALPMGKEYNVTVTWEVTEDEEPTILIDGSKQVYYRFESENSIISESEAFAKDDQDNYIHNPHTEGWYERIESIDPTTEHDVVHTWPAGSVFYKINPANTQFLDEYRVYYVSEQEVKSGDTLENDIKFQRTMSSAEAVYLSLWYRTISTTENQNFSQSQIKTAQRNIGLEKADLTVIQNLSEEEKQIAKENLGIVENTISRASEDEIRELWQN